MCVLYVCLSLRVRVRVKVRSRACLCAIGCACVRVCVYVRATMHQCNLLFHVKFVSQSCYVNKQDFTLMCAFRVR